MEIVLPQLGESITEGIVGKWLVGEGDEIDKYQPLVEVITDKVNVELPSPVSGSLTKIIANEGSTVLVGSVIAEVETLDQSGDKNPAISDIEAIDTLGGFVSDMVAVGPTGAANVPQDNVPIEKIVENRPEAMLSPAVKKLLEKHNVDISQVTGTGKLGRISRKDIEAFIKTHHVISGTLNKSKIISEAMDPVRKMTAKNMELSAANIPDAWLTIEADITNLVSLRNFIKEKFLKTNGFPITYLAFAIYSVAQAIEKYPIINSSIKQDEIIMHSDLNVGVAVASQSGLIVPVIKNIFDKSVTHIAGEIYRLVISANSGKLTHDDVSHGTFTVNNTGALGSNLSQPIIVPGQAAILTTEKIKKTPLVVSIDATRTAFQTTVNDQEAIEIRSLMNLCLSFDHRIMDGNDAAGFLHEVKQNMESFSQGMCLS